jgi:hypothetical protein
MYYNEAYEARKQEEDKLFKKWEEALNIDGGVKDEHMARTTAICLENYMSYLHGNPHLVAEDQIQTNAFTGVNLALLGLIARVIPTLVGAELVGIQALPTPKSPIFTMRWYYGNNKGQTRKGDELWKSPVDYSRFPVGLDQNYSSQIILEDVPAGAGAYTLEFAEVSDNLRGTRPFLFAGSMYIGAYNAATGEYVAEGYAPGAYMGAITTAFQVTREVEAGLGATLITGAGAALTFVNTGMGGANSITVAGIRAADATVGGSVVDLIWHLKYEYKGEADPNVPELNFEITDETVEVMRRQLRGKYTMDAAYDLQKLHGLNVDAELTNMMKVELQAEINREIVADLRAMAAIVKVLDYNTVGNASTGISIRGNYDDSHKVLLDAINMMSAEVFNIGRLGKANFVLGNPTTLAFLDRVPGFVGAGVNYNGKELGFAGSLGGKMKFYIDPNYPKDELLIGYKGPGALDTGYIHAPYLPIIATPTMINQETGDPSKIFYTRYGKTYNMFGPTGPSNKILMGEYQYSRLVLKNWPAALQF